MPVLERDEEAKFTRWLKQQKIKWKKKAPGELLDRMVFLPKGRLFIIEFKRDKKDSKLLRRQVLEIRDLRRLGYDIEVHDNADLAAQAVLDRLEATHLSETGRQADAAELLARSLARSRTREDKYKPRSRKGSVGKRRD